VISISLPVSVTSMLGSISPAPPLAKLGNPRGEVVEQPIDLALQGHERIAAAGDVAGAPDRYQ